MAQPVLEIKDLKTTFFTENGNIPAVDHVSLEVNPGEILGVVGESGCGKSMTFLSVMGLVPTPPGKIIGGEILFKGQDLTSAPEKTMRKIRGNEIGMIFQEPMTSLNPVFTIGSQLIEGIRIHKKFSKGNAKQQAIDYLKLVGMPRPEQILRDYPHHLSGGMRQRVMIAMAMACEPEVLIADEPTTALDVTIQSQILKLMKRLNEETKTSVVLITHDLGVVAEVCDRVVVMYAGNVIEEGTVRSIYKSPKHPYTEGLIQSVPDMRFKSDRLYSIPGNVPKPGTIKSGCPFAPRCTYAFDRCRKDYPQLIDSANGQRVRCFLHEHRKEKENERDIAESK
ncbi:ABC transporter ATP-binding protein [Virgibacillus siamensis]|uniref:ABC transporter ATP-binding protein n=1 Tax=Virgibacillus siamensis TaxID=480071 RepID=UPI000984C5C9|nr:ABC transporter ATP-binding protein [Virgibacillus siamensis]